MTEEPSSLAQFWPIASCRHQESQGLRSSISDAPAPEGMSVKIYSNGDKVISLPNGQMEMHCADYKVCIPFVRGELIPVNSTLAQ